MIQRGSKIFEELVVAILRNSEKTPMFSVAERREMLQELTAEALAEGRELEALSVRRPTLEDIYLLLTAEETEA